MAPTMSPGMARFSQPSSNALARVARSAPCLMQSSTQRSIAWSALMHGRGPFVFPRYQPHTLVSPT